MYVNQLDEDHICEIEGQNDDDERIIEADEKEEQLFNS